MLSLSYALSIFQSSAWLLCFYPSVTVFATYRSTMVYNTLGVFAGVSGAVGVGLGAIGAHAMKGKLNAYRECSTNLPASLP